MVEKTPKPTPAPSPTPKPTPTPSPSPWKSQTIAPGATSSGSVNPDRYKSGFQGGSNATPTIVNEDIVAFQNAPEDERAEIVKLLISAGYKVPNTTKFNKTLSEKLLEAISDASFQGLESGEPITLKEFLNQETEARKAYESGTGRPSAQVSVRTLTKDQADGLIQTTYQKLLGRDATASETKALRTKLQKAIKDNPTKTTYETRNGITYQTTSGGLNPEDFVIDSIVETNEFKKREVASPVLQKRLDEKRVFDKLAKGKSQEEIDNLLGTTAYGRGLADIGARIEEAAIEVGAQATPEEIAAITAQVYDRAIEDNPALVRKLIRDTIKVKGGRATGEAGKNLAQLKQTAAANGLDLVKTFGSELNGWLQKINAGESIDTYKQTIRDVAKIGLPDKVAAMVDRGVDLETIYSPYKKTMASVLEISPETITLDDPTLRSAIGPDKEMSIYDFQRNLRQDSRWQYTDSARSEVAGLVNTVLKDFGFVG